jgi:hypothetical protein
VTDVKGKDQDPVTGVYDVDMGRLESASPGQGDDEALDRAVLQRVFIRACWFSGVLSLIIAIIIPIPMFASGYVFSRRFFEVWTGFSMVWLLAAGSFCM